jgi:hypothetical protein
LEGHLHVKKLITIFSGNQLPGATSPYRLGFNMAACMMDRRGIDA